MRKEFDSRQSIDGESYVVDLLACVNFGRNVYQKEQRRKKNDECKEKTMRIYMHISNSPNTQHRKMHTKYIYIYISVSIDAMLYLHTE